MVRKLLKKIPLVAVFAAALLLGDPGSARADVRWSVSVAGFHDNLAPYGTWVTVGNYGSCWRPARLSAGWQPYLNGEWLYSDYGWTWASYDPWGEIPFHYGSWVYDPVYGWVWVPGTVWAPAWVTWCYGDDFVGWAPLPPTFAFAATGYFGSPLVVSSSRYVFVATNRFVGGNVSTVRMPMTRNASLLRTGTPMTRFSVSGNTVRTNGPDPRRIERATHTPIRKTSLSAAKLRPTKIDAAGPIRGSRLSLVTKREERSRESQRQLRSHSSRRVESPHRRPTVTTRRQAGPKSSRPREFRKTTSRPSRPLRKETSVHRGHAPQPVHRTIPRSPERMTPRTVERKAAPLPLIHREAPERPVASLPPAERRAPAAVEHRAPPPVERRVSPPRQKPPKRPEPHNDGR